MATSTFSAARARVDALASEAGFSATRVASAHAPWEHGDRLSEAIDKGHHGTMAWMETTLERRRHPTAMWAQAKSAIIVGVNYGPDRDPLEALKRTSSGTISVYAQGDDYHDIIKKRLKAFAGALHRDLSCEVKVFVDTAPLMEKPLAARAGLGWQGKHTNLVSRAFGSWLFLGCVLLDIEIEPDAPEVDHCGSCTACLDICPTGAFPAPYQLDARRCISYLTIEHDGSIPIEFRAAMGNRIYGCDDCLAVCPWNKFASTAKEAKLQARSELQSPDLSFLAGLDDTAFRQLFAKNPVKRIGLARFLRNVAIAIGNSGDVGLIDSVRNLMFHDRPMVRGAAIWAMRQLLDDREFAALAHAQRQLESDINVVAEWDERL